MKKNLKRWMTVLLTAAMTAIPAFSSFAAADEILFTEMVFTSEDKEEPAASSETSVSGGFAGFMGIASPSDMGSIILPGGNTPAGGAAGLPDDGVAGLPDDRTAGQPSGGFGAGWGSFMFPWLQGQEALTDGSAESIMEGTTGAGTGIAGAGDAKSSVESTAAEEEVNATGNSDGGTYAKILSYKLRNMSKSDELLEDYIEKLFYGEPEDPMLYDYYWLALAGDDLDFYEAIKDFVECIAANNENYPIFDAESIAPAVRLSKAGLGLSDSASNDDWCEAAMNYYTKNVIDVTTVMNYVYRDNPGDFYWADGTYVILFTATIEGDDCLIGLSKIYLPVEESYEGGFVDIIDRYIVFNVTNDEISAAISAAQNAKEIVAAHKGEDDLDMFDSYKEEISERITYNEAGKDENDDYVDAWRLVYVFDKDPLTTVAPKDFARAFKCLCEMSGFETYEVEDALTGTDVVYVINKDGTAYTVDMN